MTTSIKTGIVALTIILATELVGCNKKDFLETRPSTDLFIPTTLDDFQALLDNEPVMNDAPVLGELSADNYYLPYNFWNGLNTKEKNAYTWQPDVFMGLDNISDWNVPYKQVFYANVTLEGLSKLTITNSNEERWKELKGAALFARAYAFYNVAQIFAPIYNATRASYELGIPLRLAAGVDEISVRATLKETYDKIIGDLQEASQLLSSAVPYNNRNRSSKPAAYALLARTYLSMDDYVNAKLYADSCLLSYNKLNDYRKCSITSNTPFTKYNEETIFQSRFVASSTNTIGTNVLKAVTVPSCIVDSSLYRSYDLNDLRRAIFFTTNMATGNMNPKGGYTGNIFLFTGLAIDEVYLIRAECQARLGHITEAMNDLNTLLENRWKENTFVPFTASNSVDALQIILRERRKELPFRGLRWTDIRRFNKTDSSIVLKRILNGEEIILPPKDLRYTMLIPQEVINLSGISQNPR